MAVQQLLLVGGGHAHIEVLRRIAGSGWPGVNVTLISAGRYNYYSGMIPGYVAGEYPAQACAIDLERLAQRAEARFIDAVVTRIDATKRRIEHDAGSALPYDVASVDIGAGVRGLEQSAVGAHVLATRPISAFVSGAETLLHRMARRAETGRPFRLMVVGAGAGGVELAFAFRDRKSTRLNSSHSQQSRMPSSA